MPITADKVVVELEAKTKEHDAKIAASAKQYESKMAQMVAAAERAGKATSLVGVNPAFDQFAKKGADTARELENNFRRANDNISGGFERQGKVVERSFGAQRAAAANLSFQLNDIATSLASGASPLTVMAQQGGQVAQVFQQMGGGIRGAVSILGSAFTSLLNPISLVSIGLIGVTGYAIQYFAEWASSGRATSKEIEEQAKLIERVAEKWGDALPALKAYADEMKRAADERERLEATQAYVQRQYEPVAQQRDIALPNYAGALFDLQGLGNDAIPVVAQLQVEWEKLTQKLADNEAEAEDVSRVQGVLNDVIAKFPGIRSVSDFNEQLEKMKPALTDASTNAREAEKQLGAMSNASDRAKAIVLLLTNQMTGMGPKGVEAFQDIANAAMKGLVPAIEAGLTKVKELQASLEALQTVASMTRLDQLSPLFSGGGKFMSGQEFNTYQANDEYYRKVGESAAASMVKGFEGFIPKAKWDVDAFRVGFGSDTITKANGEIERVTAETIVTLADAQRDLERRLVDFQTGIQSAIGIDTWRSLNEGQQAALTSIAYNYGELPKRIVAAIQSGGGPEAVAKAIAALGGDNAGINRVRRNKEAQSYLSGTGISLSDAGLGKKKSPSDLFKGDTDEVQARIDTINAEIAAQEKLNPLIDDYGYAVEKARIEQELLSEAKKAGLEVTPQLRASIEQLAEGYARASASADQLKQSQSEVQRSAAEFQSLGRNVMGGFIRDLREGKSATEALANALDKVADKLLDMALDGLFSSKGGGGGFLGNIFGGLFGGGGFNPAGKVGLFASGTANTGGSRGQPMGVVHGQEAVIPLPMGGKVPVQLSAPNFGSSSGSAAAPDIRYVEVPYVAETVVSDNGEMINRFRRISRDEITAAGPKIVGQSVAAVGKRARTTKSYLGG